MTSVLITSNIDFWRQAALETAKSMNDQTTVTDLNATLKSRFFRISKETFKSEGAITMDGKWRRLSADYEAWKSIHFPGKTILRRTDRLFRSLTTNAENISVGGKNSEGYQFRFGTQVEYGQYHQDEKFNPPPTRKFLNPTVQQLKGVAAAIGRTIIRGMFNRRAFEEESKVLAFRNTGFDTIG